MPRCRRWRLGSLIAAVWQGILLVAAAGLGFRLFQTPAAVRFAIWFGVLWW